MTQVSQRTIIEIKKVLSQNHRANSDELYANDFPDWFVIQVQNQLMWDWSSVLVSLRRGAFFYSNDTYATPGETIIPEQRFLQPDRARQLGEHFIQKLAAFACTLASSDSLMRSIQLDGFDVDTAKLKLIPLEGLVSAQREADRLSSLVNNCGTPNPDVVLKHIQDAQSLYADGKDHPSLGESRNIIQSLIDGISAETATHGKHKAKLPGGTSNRIDYLAQVGFLTNDEKAAFNSAWGTLSAGSHPGVPEREQARIGLTLGLEFGQLLMLKFANWKKNAYQKFSKP
jgi:hypothetical protein